MAMNQGTTYNHRYLPTILHCNFQRTGITGKICYSCAYNGTHEGSVILRRCIIPKSSFDQIQYRIPFFNQDTYCRTKTDFYLSHTESPFAFTTITESTVPL